MTAANVRNEPTPWDDLSGDALLRAIGQTMERLDGTVHRERRGRRITIIAAAVVILAGSLFAAKTYVDRGAVPCPVRAASRADARTGFVRLADSLSKDNPRYPTPADRAKLHARAVEIAREAYPPLTC